MINKDSLMNLMISLNDIYTLLNGQMINFKIELSKIQILIDNEAKNSNVKIENTVSTDFMKNNILKSVFRNKFNQKLHNTDESDQKNITNLEIGQKNQYSNKNEQPISNEMNDSCEELFHRKKQRDNQIKKSISDEIAKKIKNTLTASSENKSKPSLAEIIASKVRANQNKNDESNSVRIEENNEEFKDKKEDIKVIKKEVEHSDKKINKRNSNPHNDIELGNDASLSNSQPSIAEIIAMKVRAKKQQDLNHNIDKDDGENEILKANKQIDKISNEIQEIDKNNMSNQQLNILNENEVKSSKGSNIINELPISSQDISDLKQSFLNTDIPNHDDKEQNISFNFENNNEKSKFNNDDQIKADENKLHLKRRSRTSVSRSNSFQVKEVRKLQSLENTNQLLLNKSSIGYQYYKKKKTRKLFYSYDNYNNNSSSKFTHIKKQVEEINDSTNKIKIKQRGSICQDQVDQINPSSQYNNRLLNDNKDAIPKQNKDKLINFNKIDSTKIKTKSLNFKNKLKKNINEVKLVESDSNSSSNNSKVLSEEDVVLNNLSKSPDKSNDINNDKIFNNNIDSLSKLKSLSKINKINKGFLVINTNEEEEAEEEKPLQDERIKSINENFTEKKNLTSTTGIDKLAIPERQLNDLKLEINQYPVSAVLMDHNFKVLQCNNNFFSKLFQTKNELIDTSILSHIDIDQREDFELFISNNFSNQDQEDENLFKVQDKNSNKISFIITARRIVFECNNKGSIELIILCLTSNKNDTHSEYSDCLIVDPREGFQITWSLLIMVIIMSMIYQMPYSLVFGNLPQDLYWYDIPLTAIFTFDILINLSLGFKEPQMKNIPEEAEEEVEEDSDDTHDEIYNFDRCAIIKGQMKGWLLFDVFATFPSDLFFEQMFNTQFFRTIKVIKMVKFLKILRLSKIQQVYQQLVRSKDFQSFFKKNQGQLDLLKNMIMIQIAAHQYTIIFWLYESQPILNGGQDTWATQEQYSVHSEKNVGVYTFVLFESIKTALGLGVINPQNNLEAWASIVWMCIGLSMYGYGIGNISSYLNFSNKEDLMQSTSVNYFTELCSLNNIDSRVHNMVMKELEDQQSKYQDIELMSQGKQLSLRTLVQLESEINKTFVSKFELFQYLHSTSIRMLKLSSKFEKKKIVLRKDMEMNEIQCIIQGKISIQDSKMNFINAQHSQEIFGISYFYKQLNIRYNIDILSILNRLKNKDLITRMIKKNMGGGESVLTTGSVNYNKKFDMSAEIIELKEKFKNNQNRIQIRFNFNALASDDVLYLAIPYQILEEVLLEDMESFQEIQIQHLKQSELISKADQIEYTNFQSGFRQDEIPSLLILDTGQIQEKNIKFDQVQDSIDIKLVGLNICDILVTKDQKKLRNFLEIKNDEQEFWAGNNIQKVKVVMGGFKKIIQGEIDFSSEDQFYDYYRQKKSMLNAWYIQFCCEDNLEDIEQSNRLIEI